MIRRRGHNWTAIVSAMIFMAALLSALIPAQAAAAGRTVRVAWYALDGFQQTDNLGCKSGYAYEYLQDMAAVNGWTYEYVNCDADKAAELVAGKYADIALCVPGTDSEGLTLSAAPVAYISTYIYTLDTDYSLAGENPAALNGKTAALVRGTGADKKLESYAAGKGVTVNEKYYDDVASAAEALKSGGANCLVTDDTNDPDGVRVAAVLAADAYYFMFSDAALAASADSAMTAIRANNADYTDLLHAKYFGDEMTCVPKLSSGELNWISAHGEIRVGWVDGMSPFIFEKDGQATGALISYMERISRLTELKFSYVIYPNAAALKEGLKAGEIDMTAASYRDLNSAEESGTRMTGEYYSADFALVTPAGAEVATNTVAYNVNRGEKYIERLYPNAKIIKLNSDSACLSAVADGKAQCAVIELFSARMLTRNVDFDSMSVMRLDMQLPLCFEVSAACGHTLVNILNTAMSGLDSGRLAQDATSITLENVDSYKTAELENSRTEAVVASDILCILLLLLIIAYIRFNARFINSAVRAFLLTCWAAELRFTGDLLSYIFNRHAGETALLINRIASFALMISTPLLMAAFAVFIYRYASDRGKLGKILPAATIAIAGADVALTLISAFGGQVYYVTSANEYFRGVYFPLYTWLLAAGIVTIGVWLITNARIFKRKEMAALLVMLVMPLLGTAAQLYLPDMNPANAFVTVGLYCAFLSLQSGLLNMERRDLVMTRGELDGISEGFTGVYFWDRAKKKMVGSYVSPEYGVGLENGVIAVDRFVDTLVDNPFRDAVRAFLSTEYLEKLDALTEKTTREIEYREIGPHCGEWRRITLVHLPANPERDAQLYMLFNDISFEKTLQERAHAQDRRFISAAAGVYSDINEWNMNTDTALRLRFTAGGVNEEPIAGSWEKYMDGIMHTYVLPDDRESFSRLMPEHLRTLPAGASLNCNYREVYKSGESRWHSATVKIYTDSAGTKFAMYMHQDIDDSVRERNRLRDLSEHDSMTDLFNSEKLDDMKRTEYVGLKSCGVIFFDVNYLKATNDTFGHDAGDELIMTAAESIRSITNRRTMAYRIGGDEMLVIAGDCSEQELSKMVTMWRARLAELNIDAQHKCSLAVGWAWGEGKLDLDELIRQADERMYRNKKEMNAARTR